MSIKQKSIAKHVAQIESMAISLEGRGEKIYEQQIVNKIMCNLPVTYIAVTPAWKNMPATHKTHKTLVMHLFKEESMLKLQENANLDHALFISSLGRMHNKEITETKYIKQLN